MSYNDEDAQLVPCRNPVCVVSPVLLTDLHPTGYCSSCCIRDNNFDCPICWDIFGDDE